MLPLSPSTASMGWMLGQDRAAGAFGMAGSSHGWQCHQEGTHHSVDRAGAQQEQVPHGGRSEGLLVGYFFNIF